MSEIVATNSPTFTFTYDPSAAPFTVNLQTYLDTHSNSRFQFIGTGALVFDTIDAVTPHILLLQRSASDSMPNLWEVPGGGCDEEDESILYAVARELWEEAGLKTTHIGAPIGDPHLFVSRSGKQVCKFSFLVQYEKDVEGMAKAKLNPEEHQQFLWASEDEVRKGKVGDVELNFASMELQNTVLQAFTRLELLRMKS